MACHEPIDKDIYMIESIFDFIKYNAENGMNRLLENQEAILAATDARFTTSGS